MFIPFLLVALALINQSYGYVISHCGEQNFECDDGACILRSYRCDGDADCEDHSDEKYCENSGSYAYCPDRTYFRCSDSHCIPRAWRCDGVRDCADASDENTCTPSTPSYCQQPGIFICKNFLCIPRSKVCDGTNDCKDGSDEENCYTGVLAVPGVVASRTAGVRWLKFQRNSKWGWNDNTHRAVVALYLAEGATFDGTKEEDELMAKQLELKLAVTLLRNETESVTRNRLALYINAMLVTCQNPRNFYGFDLVAILKDKTRMKENTTHPIVFIALCNANETLSHDVVSRLFSMLEYESKYPFWIDIQAMTLMALSCIINQSPHSHLAQNITSAVENFKEKQRTDGSFGNVHSTALVMQALMASGHEEDVDWDVSGAVRYLISQQPPGTGFLGGDLFAAYLVLPILNSKTLIDIARVKCTNSRIQPRNGNSITDIKNQLGPKMYVQYSLYVGDEKDVVHSLTLRLPINITVYDVMRIAAEADHKYTFEYKKADDIMYIYSIANIANDSESGIFWLLYESTEKSKDPTLNIQSPDEVIVKDGDHIIMWYRTAGIGP